MQEPRHRGRGQSEDNVKLHGALFSVRNAVEEVGDLSDRRVEDSKL